MRNPPQRNTVRNQVFIGCPWHIILPKYEAVLPKLRKKFPLSYVIVGRDDNQDAKDLLQHITERLLASSTAIFDATGGNANVSLEYGFAEAHEIPRSLYLCTHKSTKKATEHDSPIISDLAGKSRCHYKQQDDLYRLLSTLSSRHHYTILFEKSLAKAMAGKTKGQKKRSRALALKIIHALDNKDKRRRDDLVQEILTDIVGYKEQDIDSTLKMLHASELLNCSVGNPSQVRIV